MSQSPLVSAVMVNWNGAEHLRLALPTLKRQTYSPFEILVVDNGSTDSSAEVAAENDVAWLGLEHNSGLAAACNKGAASAGGEYLIFLNNDMRFPPDFVHALITILGRGKDVFASDARQLDWEGFKQIHLGTRLRRLSLTRSLVARTLIPGLDFQQEPTAGATEVIQGCAAAMAVRRSMFEQLGGFDDRLSMGWEDTEICWRAWLRGWRTLLAPEAVCWHRVGASGKKPRGAAAKFRGALGGRLLFATKHLPWPYVVGTWAVSCFGLGKELVTGRLGSLVQRASVVGECATRLPSLLGERRRMYREAGTAPRAHFERMLSIGRTGRR
jgi:GT2 family glycosyltransferase